MILAELLTLIFERESAAGGTQMSNSLHLRAGALPELRVQTLFSFWPMRGQICDSCVPANR